MPGAAAPAELDAETVALLKRAGLPADETAFLLAMARNGVGVAIPTMYKTTTVHPPGKNGRRRIEVERHGLYVRPSLSRQRDMRAHFNAPRARARSGLSGGRPACSSSSSSSDPDLEGEPPPPRAAKYAFAILSPAERGEEVVA